MGERLLLAQGREAEVFLQADGTVLKLMRQPSSEPHVRREAAALSLLARHGHSAPAVVDRVTVDGRPGLVMERVEGSDLLARLGRQPWSVLRAGRTLGEAHATMHDCVAPPELPDLRDVLRERIELATPLPQDLREAALALLGDMPAGDRLCHGDLHLGNMLGSWSSPMIIDWGDAARGDPTADVARTALLLRIGEPAPGAPAAIRRLVAFGRPPLVASYLASYRRQRGINQHLLDRWSFVRAAARLHEPIPAEHPKLLDYLRRRLPSATP